MLPYIITPDAWFSLISLSLTMTIFIVKATNSTDLGMLPYSLQQRDLNKSHFNHEASSRTNKRFYFFDDVNTKVYAKVGDKAELPCLIYGIDANDVVISWWKAGEFQELSLGLQTWQHRYYLRRSFHEDWTLVIDNIQEDDAGFYACQINTDTLLEKIFLLNVTANPSPMEFKSSYSEFLKDEGFQANDERHVSEVPFGFTSSAAFQSQNLFMSFIPVLFNLFQTAFASLFPIDPT